MVEKKITFKKYGFIKRENKTRLDNCDLHLTLKEFSPRFIQFSLYDWL